MGFLFDDDPLATGSPEARRLAIDHLWELVGWPAPEAPAPRASREALPLTKFRRRMGAAPSEPAAPVPKPGSSALGRMRLIKRARRGERGASASGCVFRPF
jgi:hypothetical protein